MTELSNSCMRLGIVKQRFKQRTSCGYIYWINDENWRTHQLTVIIEEDIPNQIIPKVRDLVFFSVKPVTKLQGECTVDMVRLINFRSDFRILLNCKVLSDHNRLTAYLDIYISKEMDKRCGNDKSQWLSHEFEAIITEKLAQFDELEIDVIAEYIELFIKVFPEKTSLVDEMIYQQLPQQAILRLWERNVLTQFPIQTILQFFPSLTDDELVHFLGLASSEDLSLTLFSLINGLEQIDTTNENSTVIRCLRIASRINRDIESKLFFQIIDICSKEEGLDLFLCTSQGDLKRVFEPVTSTKQEELINSIIETIGRIDSPKKLSQLKKCLTISSKLSGEVHKRVCDFALERCPDQYSLELWLLGVHDRLDFNLYKKLVISLAQEEQRKFVKKVLNSIHIGNCSLTAKDMVSIREVNNTSPAGQGIAQKNQLDFSTKVILATLAEIISSGGISPKEINRNIFELILDQFMSPKDILKLEDYFDKCLGRCKTKGWKKTRDPSKIPKHHIICDGRKTTEDPDSPNEVFWWCANQKCWEPSRRLHNSKEWEQYTLWDFMEILELPHQEKDYEIFLSVINKANNFFEHLNCKDCGHLLYPKGKSKYAYWGVNLFSCRNNKCSQEDQEIYLSHCINGFCPTVIDSRTSKKCCPEGYSSQECGWYICNFCLACCTTEKIEKRKFVIECYQHEEYNCHNTGHMNQGVICCNKCGSQMKLAFNNDEDYSRIRNWILNNYQSSQRISGFHEFDNKITFWLHQFTDSVVTYRKRLKKLYFAGFWIKDYLTNSDAHLIREPANREQFIKNIMVCTACDNVIDTSLDHERRNAIKQFHTLY
jgi:hypothetical protein